MGNTEQARELLIQATTDLIEEYHGQTDKITSRLITNRAGVGLGLINYHFGSKDELIGLCVQRIIGKMIHNIPDFSEIADERERVNSLASYVFEFMFRNSSISIISILSAFHNYTDDCNSAVMRSLLQNVLFSWDDSRIRAHALLSAMEVALVSEGRCGFDLSTPEARRAFISNMTQLIFP